jgi:L-cysteine desulfidase
MNLREFFQNEVKPALGCTEPGAVALATSTAASYLTENTTGIHLRLSANIYKNGASVGIPGAQGLRGNLLAAALGAIAGDSTKGLQALEQITFADVEQAQTMLKNGLVTQEIVEEVPNIYVEATLKGTTENVTAIISGRHDQIVEIRKNGKVIKQAKTADTAIQGRPAYLEELIKLNLEQLWELAGTIDQDLEEFLLTGVEMNKTLVNKGYEELWGLGIGYSLQHLAPDSDLLWKVKAAAGAAADVRMAGGAYPVMSSAGSGNHGITAIVPVATVAQALGKTPRETAEALALSHLVTGYIKAHTGRLTPVCGCAIAAGAGAAAAIVRLGGGTPAQAETAIALLISSVLGMICDGAKGSCAMKVATAAGEAYTSAQIALNGGTMEDLQGVVSPTLAETAAAIATLSKVGFAAVDSVILQIMQKKD